MKTITISLGIFNLKKLVTKTVILIFTSLLVFSSCENPFGNVAAVKKSVYGDYKSLTLGNAFDNYQYFVKTEWREFSTVQGREYVEFKGYYFEKSIVLRIQFIIYANNTEYEIAHVDYKFENQSDDEFKKVSLYNISSLLDDIYSYKEIDFFSNIKEPEAIEINMSDLPKDFIDFINEFSSNPEFQIANIEFPLENAGLDIPAPTKNKWKILTKEDIFDGTQKLEDGINIIQGKFIYENKNYISYSLGFPESSIIYHLGFKKINDRWKLVEYFDDEMTAF